MNKQKCSKQNKLCRHYTSDRCEICSRKYEDLYDSPIINMPLCPKCGTNEHVGMGKGDDFFWCIECMQRFKNDKTL